MAVGSRASVGLMAYVVLQLVGAYRSARGDVAGVAYLAHLGGLGVGALVGLWVRVARDEHRLQHARAAGRAPQRPGPASRRLASASRRSW